MLFTNTRYKADLQRVGSALDESIRFLSEFAKESDWDKVKAKVISENLLQKRSSTTVRGIIRAIRQRYIEAHPPLPEAHLLAKMISSSIPYVAKVQILYPYICDSDTMVKDTILYLVKPTIDNSYSPHLMHNQLSEFLNNQSRSHPEISNWSELLKQRWEQGFFAFLRDCEIMKPAPSLELIRPIIRIEAFTFFMLSLILTYRLPLDDAFDNPVWSLYFLNRREIEEFLVDVQAKGWIEYTKAGDIIELKTQFNSLEEWIDVGLGY